MGGGFDPWRGGPPPARAVALRRRERRASSGKDGGPDAGRGKPSPARAAAGSDADYDALRALDADNSPHARSMAEEEINALPVFKYKAQAQQGSASSRKSDGSSQLLASSTGSGKEKNDDAFKADGTSKTLDDELTCSVCLEQVDVGDLLRSLPCLHQFHVNCIDPWLRQQGTCPVCKHQVSDGWQGGGNGEEDSSYMV